MPSEILTPQFTSIKSQRAIASARPQVLPIARRGSHRSQIPQALPNGVYIHPWRTPIYWKHNCTRVRTSNSCRSSNTISFWPASSIIQVTNNPNGNVPEGNSHPRSERFASISKIIIGPKRNANSILTKRSRVMVCCVTRANGHVTICRDDSTRQIQARKPKRSSSTA